MPHSYRSQRAPHSEHELMLKTLSTLAVLCAGCAVAQTYQPNWDSLDRRPIPSWFTDAKFGIFIHWGVYSVPAYAPVIPGKLAYAEWYWHAITEGRKPNAGPVDAGSWEMHKKLYGADYDYADNFAPQFRAELFDPAHWAECIRAVGCKVRCAHLQTPRGLRALAEQRGVQHLGTAMERAQGPHRDLRYALTISLYLCNYQKNVLEVSSPS